MSQIITTWVRGNVEAQKLIDSLGAIGVPREHIRMCEPNTDPEHGSDAYGTWSLTWGVLGGLIGAGFCWLIMAWSPVSIIGAMWGAAIGALCGARYGGYAVVGRVTAQKLLPWTQVDIDIADSTRFAQVQAICQSRIRS